MRDERSIKAKSNPYLEGKVRMRREKMQKWIARQLTPKVKDWGWAHKFRYCPHLGVKLALKQEFLDEHTEQEFLHDVWGDET